MSQVDEGRPLPNFQANIDSVVKVAITKKAFPGCVVAAYKGDSAIFQRAYGHHTYDSINETKLSDLFDLASLTKVMAGTLALMKLYEDGYYNLDDPIGGHLDGLGIRGLRKKTFRQVLSHQAGLKGWIRYYKNLQTKDGALRKKYVTTNFEEGVYSISDSLALKTDYYPVIRKAIRKSRVSKSEEFVYSDLFFYMVPELVEKWTGVSFEDYLNINFYQPMEANSLCFNPSDKFILSEIVPTELDTFFRMTQIHGKVHDEGAILMGGISGHAGLFGNADDAAKIWRMYLNGGVYQDRVFLKESTLNLFTTTQFPNTGNRRGLGFDKPLLEYDSIKSSVAKSVSSRSFGHSGFTGTLIWADPEYDLVYIFLSNRVYPSRSNTMIYKLNVRPTIHQILYDEITKPRPFLGF